MYYLLEYLFMKVNIFYIIIVICFVSCGKNEKVNVASLDELYLNHESKDKPLPFNNIVKELSNKSIYYKMNYYGMKVKSLSNAGKVADERTSLMSLAESLAYFNEYQVIERLEAEDKENKVFYWRVLNGKAEHDFYAFSLLKKLYTNTKPLEFDLILSAPYLPEARKIIIEYCLNRENNANTRWLAIGIIEVYLDNEKVKVLGVLQDDQSIGGGRSFGWAGDYSISFKIKSIFEKRGIKLTEIK